jgi:hypothetical protein
VDSRPVALRRAELEEPEPRPTFLLLLRYGAATALGAFLLFQVEPLLAQALLPRFGGASSVWAACVVVFQVLLLAGYAYAHLLDRWSTRRQAVIHTAVLLVSLVFLPITAMHESARAEAGEPVFRIVKLVLRNVGLPYLILAATGPLLQSWFARETRAAPYRFYALSNAASLLGLLTYPFLMQPLLDLPGQDRLWSVSYALFVLLLLTVSGAAFRNHRGPSQPREQGVTVDARSRADRALWIALPAAASMLLLGITNEMTSEMAAVPFLWVLPLAVYLVTFILAFEKPGWYSRRVLGPLFGLCLLAWTPRLLLFPFEGLPNLLLCLVTLFLAAWICHGELVRLRPAPERLTGFYLSIATGGALGGILVGLVAPLVFTGYWEVPLGLFAVLLLFLVSLHRDPASPWQGGKPARVWTWLVIGTGVAGPVVFAGPLLAMWNYDHQERNFYGVLQIGDQRSASGEPMRVLLNGSTVHGTQFLSPLARRFPTTYYGAGSGIALALEHHPKRRAGEPLRVGAIGLGAGTIAAWGRTGDLFRFYEIDPAVVAAARSSFTFLADSHAAIETVLGDGRLSLSRESPERTRFDVLAVDAFSGGSIPTHLLTRESFAIYRKVLAPDGIIAVHVSNRYLRLAPVVRGAAADAGLPAVLVVQNADPLTGLEANDWVLITASEAFRQEIASRVTPWTETQKPVLWTDQKTSLLRVLR